MNKKIKITTKAWQSLIAELAHRTSLSLEELAAVAQKFSRASTDYIIWLLQQKGIIKHVQGKRRGLYVVMRNKGDSAFVKDPIEAVQALYGENVFCCYGTALYMHGLSRYGMLSELFFHHNKALTRRPVGDVVVRFVKTRLGEEIGTTEIKYGKRILRITDLERTIIDCIHRPAYAQGWENVLQALNKVEKINVLKMVQYVKEYHTPTLVSKVGVILDYFAHRWKVPLNALDTLHTYLPRNPVRFNRYQQGKFNRKWNVYVPGDFLNGK